MNFKKLLPFEDYVLTTKLSTEVVLQRIADNIELKEKLGFFPYYHNDREKYVGQIISRGFMMRRKINYKNSFLPLITGQVTTYREQTQVHIKMQVNEFVSIFSTVWLVITGFASVISIPFAIATLGHNEVPSMLFFPFPMFAFGYLMIYFSFKLESKKSKAFLAKLLEGV